MTQITEWWNEQNVNIKQTKNKWGFPLGLKENHKMATRADLLSGVLFHICYFIPTVLRNPVHFSGFFLYFFVYCWSALISTSCLYTSYCGCFLQQRFGECSANNWYIRVCILILSFFYCHCSIKNNEIFICLFCCPPQPWTWRHCKCLYSILRKTPNCP